MDSVQTFRIVIIFVFSMWKTHLSLVIHKMPCKINEKNNILQLFVLQMLEGSMIILLIKGSRLSRKHQMSRKGLFCNYKQVWLSHSQVCANIFPNDKWFKPDFAAVIRGWLARKQFKTLKNREKMDKYKSGSGHSPSKRIFEVKVLTFCEWQPLFCLIN